jgi:hypothetical protein
VLVSDQSRALAISDCVAYSNGFEFTISLRSSAEIPHQVFGGTPSSPHADLEVEIAYPEGQHGTSADHGIQAMTAHYEAAYEGKEPPVSTAPVVMPQSGGGGGKRYDWRFWCWPLPPSGTMAITVEWARVGIQRQRLSLMVRPYGVLA